MTQPQSKPSKRTCRRFLAQLAVGLLILLVLFHRPFLLHVIKTGFIQWAASEKIRLSFQLEGNVFNELRMQHLQVIPEEPGHINQLEAEDLRIHYSLFLLVTHGFESFLKSCEVKNMTIEITPVLPGSVPERKQPGFIVHDILHPPFFLADRYRINNLNFVSHTPDGDFILNGVEALLDYKKDGFVQINQLQIPNVHTWNKINAKVICKERTFTAHDFSPDSELQIHTLELETHPDRPYRLALEANAFGGTAFATFTGNNGAEEISDAHLSIRFHHGSLQKGFAYFKHPISVDGNLSEFILDLKGNPDFPSHWSGNLSARIEAFGVAPYQIENATFLMAVKNGIAHCEAEITQGQNKLQVTSNTQLPEQSLDFGESTLEGPFKLECQDLKRFSSRITQGLVSGTGAFLINKKESTVELNAKAIKIETPNFSVSQTDLHFEAIKKWPPTAGTALNSRYSVRFDSIFDGLKTNLHLNFHDLTANDYAGISGELAYTSDQNRATLTKLELKINSTDGIYGDGAFTLGHPFDYAGQLSATIHDLALFNPLLQAAGLSQPIAGSLLIDWHGFGTPTTMQHTGYGTLKLTQGRLGNLKPIEVSMVGNYSPESMAFPTLEIEAGPNKLNTMIRFQNESLVISNIHYQFNHQEIVSGMIQVPLDLHTPARFETIIPTSGKVSADLKINELPIESIVPDFKSPVQGRVSGTFNAEGNLEQLKAHLQIQGRNLTLISMPKVGPASMDLNLSLAENQLALSGTLKQTEITPLQMTGEIAFPFLKIIHDQKMDEQTAIRFAIKLPKTSVAFLTQLIPDLRFVEGQASLDVGIAGTFAKPELIGAAQLDLPAVRFQKPDWPAINRIKGDLIFSGNRLTINRLGGEVSGGNFNLGGQVRFEKLTDPVLDLRFTSQGALIARNEMLTIRTDTDVKITGPVTRTEVTGEMDLTKSRFFREIEILPLQLPGRPAPKPPETTGRFSFKEPPFRDWKFNLAIKTKDPFLIRGNLTNGGATIDLKLGGTGFAPTLDGSIRIENFTATLPFSTLEMSYGFIYFNQKNPFVPILDFQATSSLRDYNIRANIYGDASNPQTVLNSDPPLPQEEILALLATGATTQDLTGSADLVAGRAAVLVFQHFYSKIFKRPESSEHESFLNRFQLDVGTVDPRTGKQEAAARFKMGEKFYLIGSVNVLGDIRGQVKYLLQFR